MKDSLIYVVEQLLKKNEFFFDKNELAFQIQSHPSYPSMHAITGVLDHFNIDNVAAEVPKDLETLLELPNCFIAQIETDNVTALATIVRNKLNYIVYRSSSEKEKLTQDVFLQKFTGIIVAVEKDETKTLKPNSFNRVLIFVLLTVTLLVFQMAEPTLIISFFFVTSFIGILVSLAIYQQELGIGSVIGNAFCAASNEKKDCDAVLSSKGAVIFKDYKLSDASLLYFSGLTVALFLLNSQNSPIDILYGLSILIFPVTVYSIYYQFRVIKKWCLLCLSIVGVLWLQTAFAVLDGFLNVTISLESIALTIFSFLVIFVFWSFLKPTLKEYQENKKIKIDAFKFKRNYTLFSSLLNQQKTIATKISNIPEIIFGNELAPLEIVVVSNPFCGHCKAVHKMIENILQKYKEEVKIIIRFNINTSEVESDVVKITSRLVELYNTKETANCLTAMGQIYEGESVRNWLKKWGECYEKEKFIAILKKESTWCKENEINFTPEMLINGQSFPKEYDRSDLVYFIEELYEESCLAITEKTNNEFELTT